ncbi:DUF445 domain-containing protein [Solicola gregarius]|uniref:DUF445 domain-containing protein n=1 Tax=Solicola gregarius TaxID=2908642 RepID=A0AA46YK22_9ACTN|nr:DUF445 domain-containing protein [Solicola gregarius]UYM04992.1 DUF445 domain-containing protein [Solicola gregarius]
MSHVSERSRPVAPSLLDGATDDDERRRALRRMRIVAVSLLIAAAVVYALTLDRDGAWGFVNAAAEAAMVGAIADWFAVTALFRHPLGIPIPHTALIPNRKNALAKSLEEFVGANFLVEDVVRERVRDAHVAQRVGEWLADERHSKRLVDEAATVLGAGMGRIRDEDVDALVGDVLIPQLIAEPLSPAAGQLLAQVVESGSHHGLVDLGLDEIHRWLQENEEVVERMLAERAPWWTPQWLDERVIRRLRIEVVSWVADIRDDPAHPARKAFDRLLADLANDLQSDPVVMANAESLKERVLSQPGVRDASIAIWKALRDALTEALDDPDGMLRRRGLAEVRAFGSRLANNPELQQRVDAYAEDGAAYLVGRYGAEVTTIISETVGRWDGRDTANRIELYVGRDLQFIRINGTVVGGLVGLVIHTVTVLV